MVNNSLVHLLNKNITIQYFCKKKNIEIKKFKKLIKNM